MQLNNFYERALWNEWRQLVGDFKKRSIRQLYYPQHMDTYYQFESKMIITQRQQVSNAKQHFHQLGDVRLTQEQQKIWSEQTKIIRDHSSKLFGYNLNIQHYGYSDEFFEILNKLEDKRLQIMVEIRSAHIEEINRQEAAETLILMQKQEIANEKRRITNEKRRMAYEEAKQNPQVLRRSARIGLGKTI